MGTKKILYIGQMFNIAEMSNYSGVSVAGALYEYHAVTGLQNENIEITAITVPPVAAWPRDKTLYYKKQKKTICEGITSMQAPFLNLPYIKQLCQMDSVYKLGKKYLKQNPNAVILSYNTYPQIGVPAQKLVDKFGVRHICLLADLPYDDRSNPNIFRKIIWNIYGGTAWKLIDKCKEYVVLNENAIKVMPNDIKYTIVEGGIEPSAYIHNRELVLDENGKKIVMYAGALTEYSGILQLIEAMKSLVDKELVLHIYGDGDNAVKERIYEISKVQDNVVYKGKVSVEEIRKLQANAWLLVNPRPVDDPISKVTFPSKLLEYMASGTPVLSTKINSLRKEYFDYLYISETETPNDLANAIINIYQTDDKYLFEFGQKAKKFVLNEKCWQKQCKKIKLIIST